MSIVVNAIYFNCAPDNILIVFCMYFKIALWVIAYRAYFRCFCSHYDMSTVTAFPYFDFALFKYLRSFNILKKCTVSFFMMFLNLSYSSEFCSKFWKSFFLRCFGKPFIHICPLVVFTFCSSSQHWVLGSRMRK